jgi:type I restriction enzyme, S subunit
MNKFEKCFLKDVAVTQTGPFGTQLHEEDYVTEGTPIVTVEHLGEIGFNLSNLPLVSDKDKTRLSKYILKEGDIVFSRVGSIDRCTYVSKREDGWMFSGRCLRVRINEKANAKFISFYFRQKYFKEMMLNISVGATMPSLNTSLMDNIPLYLPIKSTQQKIASILSSLDSKIELNNRINAELEAMAKTIYDYWFVQFDFPDKNGKPYKASGGKMVWSEKLKREVPEGWEGKTLSTYLNCNLNTIRKNNKLIGIKYLDTSNLTENRIDFVQEIDLQNDTAPSRAQRVVKKNDILFSTVRPNLRHFGIIKNPAENLIASTGFAILSHKENAFYNDFFYMFITSEPSLKKLEAIAASSVSSYPSINYSDILNLLIVLPSKIDVVKALSKKLSIYFLAISLRQDENKKIAELRDWLLPMLMNGQVKVK